MITARIEMDDGGTCYLGSGYGSLFDMDPLTSIEVDISTQKSFQQAGVTVAETNLGGISRTISGSFISDEARTLARQLCRVVGPMKTGRLYLGDAVYTEFYTEKTPELTFRSHDFIDFSFMIFSASPYWTGVEAVTGVTGVYLPAFTLPACYDSHTFAVMADSACTVINSGEADSPYSLTLKAKKDCSSMGIINMDTLEKLELDAAFTRGDSVTVGWTGGRLSVTRNGSENLFYALTEDSDLFFIHPGANLIGSFAAEGSGYVSARIKFSALFASYMEV